MSAPSPTPATKSKCSPEQLERLARAREKALERRQALSALKKKEKAMADEIIKQRIRKVDELEKELMGAKSGKGGKPTQSASKPKTKSRSGSSKVRPPTPSESESSESESESESEEEEEPAQKQQKMQKSSRVHTRPQAAAPKVLSRVPAKAQNEPDWDSLMRRVFPLD